MSEIDGDDPLPNMRRGRTLRSELAKFLPSPRLVKEFENLTANVQEVIPAAILATDSTVQTAMLGVSSAQGLGESARAAIDQLIPAVRLLQSRAAQDRGLSSDVARIRVRLEQLEIIILALTRTSPEIQRLQTRIATLESLVLGA